jgi:thymidylate synthase
MNHEETGGLNNDFRTCIARLMEHGLEANPRGTVTKELLNYNITLDNPRSRVITFPERNTNSRYLLGEFIWYANGSSHLEGILPYSKFWANITNSGDHDGYEKGTVNSNYGNRLFGMSILPSFMEGGKVGVINQWQETIDLLARDKDTRQAVMNIHVPEDRHVGNKDVPCTLTLQWFIRENKLCLIVNMRSNDVILGFTNDVFQFTMLQECMLVNLKTAYPDLELGHYFHNAGSMHIYDRHFEMANKIVANENDFDLEMIPMDHFDGEICMLLQAVEKDWQEAKMADDFDFTKCLHWNGLTSYWQTCVLALMGKNEAALHKLFGGQLQ